MSRPGVCATVGANSDFHSDFGAENEVHFLVGTLGCREINRW